MTPDTEYRLIPLTQNQFAIVDSDLYDHYMQWKWHAAWNACTRSFYARRNSRTLGGKRHFIFLHREILGLVYGDPMSGDHIDGNTLDNRRSNLRKADRYQNARNYPKPRNNTSGYKGVSLHKMTGRWQAYIGINGKFTYLGLFDNPEDASAARNAAAVSYHGEFARME